MNIGTQNSHEWEYREPWISLSARAICSLIFDFKCWLKRSELFGQLSKRVTRCSTMDNIYKQESDPRYRYKLKKSQVGVLPFFHPNDWKMTNSLLGNTRAPSGDLMASFTRPPPMFTRQCERASGILHPCSWCFPVKNWRDSLSACAMRGFAKIERIRQTNLTARLPKKCFLPARSMSANITLKEMCVCVL